MNRERVTTATLPPTIAYRVSTALSPPASCAVLKELHVEHVGYGHLDGAAVGYVNDEHEQAILVALRRGLKQNRSD